MGEAAADLVFARMERAAAENVPLTLSPAECRRALELNAAVVEAKNAAVRDSLALAARLKGAE